MDQREDFEFERKFFVRELPATVLAEPDPVLIVQSYFLAAEGYALRVRVQGPAGAVPPPDRLDDGEAIAEMVGRATFGALTAKGPYVGGTRYEAERELDPGVGLEMVRRGGRLVTKYRYAVWLGEDGWVVDQFAGANAPLIVAECEREGPVTDLLIPDFCLTEVTADPRFANDALAVRPYRAWREEFEAELARTGPRFTEGFGANRRGNAADL